MSKAKVINVFFDTEFTKFRTMEDEPKLISIGCVSQDGREFYAELTDTYVLSDCSQFVIDVVLPLLKGGDARMFEIQLAHRLSRWVSDLGDDVVFRSDSPSYDWPFVQYLFTFYGCWPSNLRKKCSTVYFDNANLGIRYNNAQYEYWKANAHLQHNALIDAQSMQFAWNQAIWRAFKQRGHSDES